MSTKIHVLSLNELTHTQQKYGRLRAFCPIHGSDKQRSLSIAAHGDMQGWGHCHSCKATVVIAELNPESAKRLGYRGELQEVNIPEQQAEKWQREELAALQSLYPAMQQALKRDLPRAYLSQRGIPFDLVETLGVGYLPQLTEQQLKRHPQIKKWQNRLIFPYKSYAGDTGYVGRSLALWRPGMDENEHKQLLDEQEIRRYEKTWRSGLFHQRPLETYERIHLVEGPFDWLALLAEGLSESVALAGTNIEIAALPLNIASVTLAFDNDQDNQDGLKAAQKLAKELRRHGIPAEICIPPEDGKGKDWSERYRLHGREGLAPLLSKDQDGEASPVVEPVAQKSVDFCWNCGAESWVITDTNNEAYCKACWKAKGLTPASGEACCVCGDFSDRYDDELKPYCESCWLKQQIVVSQEKRVTERPVPASMTKEQFLGIAEQLAGTWPGGCSITRVFRKGEFTLEDRVRDLQEQERQREREMWQARRKVRT